ncbi:MAG TPA: HD domain-containing protein [Thermoanaerobaculia bacterium]|nr:HD domain-containing protein [Thermoanaerobaculia bacterium]
MGELSLRFEGQPDAWRAVLAICGAVARRGGRAHLVGGCVRDALLGLSVHDFDLEVFGVAPDDLESLLRESYEVDLVGEAFGVLKLRGLPIDVALPRREAKVGRGHRAFHVLSDPQMSFSNAAARRDFTINAIAWEPLRGELVDPFDGVADLRGRILRHTSPRFVEDPLRVLRGMQLASRFELMPAAETVALARTIDLEGLAVERIFEEWRKLLLLGPRPSLGLRFLRAGGWLRHFPELEDLVGCPQDPRWHPEGCVWRHTLHVLDAFAGARTGDAIDDLVVGLACLCHDLGKPPTTKWSEQRWRSLGHEAAGEEPSRRLMARLGVPQRHVDDVVRLVLEHLRPEQLFRAGAGDVAVRRLARRVQRIDRLVRLAVADARGRPPLPDTGEEAAIWLLERARSLEVEAAAPKPLVLGRHLIAAGLSPGPHFRALLDRCFEAQLDGAFQDTAGGVLFLGSLLREGAAAGEEIAAGAGGPAGSGERGPSP